MTTIAVTAASSHLGQHVITSLIERGAAPTDIVAVVRNAEKAAPLADQGVQVRVASYDDAEALVTALAGTDRVLLISGNEMGQRVQQHANVIEAAKAAGVELLAYTSGPKADTAPVKLFAEHKATEELIRESGLGFAFLRNGWYVENYAGSIPAAVEHGVLNGAGGTGTVSLAPRADYAEAAAAVLVDPEPAASAVYELGGESVTYARLAEIIGEVAGAEVAYNDLPEAEYVDLLVSFGLPRGFAELLADADVAISRGDLHVTSGDLERLLGRKPTPIADTVRDLLAQPVAAH